MASYPASVSFDHQKKSSRLAALFTIIPLKSLALIPHFIILMILQFVSGILSFIGVFAVLFTGKYPEGLERFLVKSFAWRWRVNAYMFCMTDQYPPFEMEPKYPAAMSFSHQKKSSRLWALLTIIPVKVVMLIPHFVVTMVLGIASAVLMFIGVFVVLFTGKYPEGMEKFIVMTLKYVWNVQTYMMCMTDQYPPFNPKTV